MTPRARVLQSLACVALLFPCAVGARAPDSKQAQNVPPIPGPAATHTMFMGVDISVQRDDQLLPVRDVQGDFLVVKQKGKEIHVPTRGKPLAMKVSHALKVASQTALLDKVNVGRGYTPGNDPIRKFRNAAGASAGADAVASLEQVELAQAVQNLDRGLVILNTGGNGDMASAQANVDRETAKVAAQTSALSGSLANADSQTISTGVQANIMEGELADGAYDALDISFRLSSPKPLEQAYVVVTAVLTAGEGSAAKQLNWVYAKSVGRVDENPVRIYIKQGGFPPGFVIADSQIHVYNLGEEVATNVAPMRVELSRDEAFQYAAIDYVSKHKNETLPAGLAIGQNTGALNTRLAESHKGGPVYVEVAATGLAGRVFRDRDCVEPLNDEVLVSILHDLRFNPALSRGKAVKSVAAVKASPETT